MDSNVAQIYHNLIDMAVKINITLSQAQAKELTEVLLKACAKEPEEPETLFLQGAINYIRAVGAI